MWSEVENAGGGGYGCPRVGNGDGYGLMAAVEVPRH